LDEQIKEGESVLDFYHGGQAILTFRSIILSKQFDTAWEEIKKFYLKPLALPNNVVKFVRK